MNNLLRIPIACHSSTCSNFGTQRSSLRLSRKKNPKSCASTWLSDTWNAHNEDSWINQAKVNTKGKL